MLGLLRGSAAAAGSGFGHYQFSSRALPSIRRHLEQHQKPVILELGPVRPTNLEFFSEHSSIVLIEDIRSLLLEQEAAAPLEDRGQNPHEDREEDRQEDQPEEAVERTSGALLGLSEKTRCDLVLCWDLIGYMTPLECASLLSKLQGVLAPEALLLVYLLDTSRALAAQGGGPLLFDILEEDAIHIEQPSAAVEPLRFCTRGDLSELFPGATLESSMRLRSGLFEMLFRFSK